MENGKRKTENSKLNKFSLSVLLAAAGFFSVSIIAQETPPAPSAPPALNVPQVKSGELPNGLEVVSVERRNVPLVTVSLLIKSGANAENAADAGLADMTASLLLKGTKTRTATQIAEEIEFLGGNINSGAGWNSSNVSLNVTSDKLDQGLVVMSDTILNPTFLPKEIQLYKTQAIDSLNVQLKQPSSLAAFVASRYSFGEHAAFGTPESIAKMNRLKIAAFYRQNFFPKNAVLIFAGDITQEKAMMLAAKFFSGWRNSPGAKKPVLNANVEKAITRVRPSDEIIKRILVIDLPNSGQAAVNYSAKVDSGRSRQDDVGDYAVGENYFPAIVLNSLLGGGYSSRLNQEIRIKRGLSYGAGSSFGWRDANTNFGTRTQTKNESAAEVAELVLTEVKKLGEGAIADVELNPRKSVLTGSFGRNLETTEGLAAAVADLYSFDLPASELNGYTKNVQTVTDAQLRRFAGENLNGGDIIIVGDYAKFKDDLAKRFPNMKIEVVPANSLDLRSDTLRKN